MDLRPAPQLDRLDRYVRRSYVRTPAGTPRDRVQYSLEEALRLANLPGEEEGRIYCFRRISFSGIPAEASRKVWMDTVQQVLALSAAQAVHATDPTAGSANAVYFHGEQEALEILLRRSLQPEAAPDWFASSVLGVAPEMGRAMQIQTILERLHQPTVPPGAAAAIVLAAIDASDPAPLLAALPAELVRDWLREFDNPKSLSGEALPARLPGQVRTSLQQAAAHFGWRDSRIIWLAAQAMICLTPSILVFGTAVRIARATVRSLESEQARLIRRDDTPLPPGPPRSTQPLVFDDEDESGLPSGSTERSASALAGAEALAAALSKEPADTADLPASLPAAGAPASASIRPGEPQSLDAPPCLSAAAALLGEPTEAAGLYFLLHVLRRLGIAAAVEACPALVESDFVAHILKQLAAHEGVLESDPILLALRTDQSQFRLSGETLGDASADLWPQDFPPARRTGFGSDTLLRVWALAIRRWCWRMGKITVREILHRHGRVWLTRTDLDVTLPLAQIEIRIRRIGLDIDPGWVPWLGKFGRVVRFHYRGADTGEWSC